MKKFDRCPYCGSPNMVFRGHIKDPVEQVIVIGTGDCLHEGLDHAIIHYNKTVRCDQCGRKLGNFNDIISMYEER